MSDLTIRNVFDLGNGVNENFVVAELFENQRWFPLKGWGGALLPTDRPHWSSEDGKEERRKETYNPRRKKPQAPDEKKSNSPTTGAGSPTSSSGGGPQRVGSDWVDVENDDEEWQWITDWAVWSDAREAADPLTGTDGDGWQYAKEFPFQFHKKKHATDIVRRRKWVRVMQRISGGAKRPKAQGAEVHTADSNAGAPQPVGNPKPNPDFRFQEAPQPILRLEPSTNINEPPPTTSLQFTEAQPSRRDVVTRESDPSGNSSYSFSETKRMRSAQESTSTAAAQGTGGGANDQFDSLLQQFMQNQ
jgi:hypothetical protein